MLALVEIGAVISLLKSSALLLVIRRLGDEYLKGLLYANQNNGGFENALAEVQLAFTRDQKRYADPMHRLQGAVSSVLDSLNQAFFALPGMEFQKYRERMLRTFLSRFDAIFTLNQDILLEHHYFCHVESSGNWNGAQLPGMTKIPNQEYVPNSSWGKDFWVPLDAEKFQVDPRCQPCFKLHGSSNWRDSEGGKLLVIGGDKSRAIQSHAVLAWSFDKFREYLGEQNVKLFIIGYGFRDTHINEVIIEAVNSCGLKFFVIDHYGSEVVKHANPSFGGAVYQPNALDDAFRRGLIGESKRNLSETFGSEPVSHKDVMHFFD